MCNERNIPFRSYGQNIVPSKHLNESKFDLNNQGIKVFAEHFSKFLVELNRCQLRKTNLNRSKSLAPNNESHDCETASKYLRKLRKFSKF